MIKIPASVQLDEHRAFVPVRISVLTVSDTRDAESDTSGALLAQMIVRDGHIAAERAWVRDDVDEIRAQTRAWVAAADIDVVIATGGTGLTGRDVTPEAMRALFDREMDGFAHVWHATSFENVGLSTLQSRACAGVAGDTFIFSLPGSNGACRDGWEKIIRWQLDSRARPCNLVELMPRLTER